MLSTKKTTQYTVLIIAVSCLLGVALTPGITTAQSDTSESQLNDDERASVMFDMNLKKLRDHSLMKDVDIKELMDQRGMSNEDFDVSKLNRVFGGMQIPDDPSAMQPQPGEDLKMNFFMRFEFEDSASATEMIESIKGKGSNTYDVDGKTYYGPDDAQQAPSNLRAHVVNDTTVEMGTERYVLLANRNVVSTKLADFWKQVPKDSAIRLSVDLESNREVVDALLEQGKANAASSAAPYFDIVKDLSGLTLGVDFNSDTMLTLRASGKNTEGTEKLMTGINGLLGMGKLLGQQGLAQSGMDDAAQKVFKELLSSLNAKSEGNTVKVDIAKPAGFDDVIGEMIER